MRITHSSRVNDEQAKEYHGCRRSTGRRKKIHVPAARRVRARNAAAPGRQVRRGRAAAAANKDHKDHGAAVVNRARPAREDVRVFRVLKARVAAGDPKVLRENRARPARKA